MRRRSRAGGKLANARSRKAKTLKPVRRSYSAFGQETEVARLTRELKEAQEQQVATAEVLKIISTSPTELQAILEVVVRSAARYCKADDVTLFELDGQELREAAHWGALRHGGESFRFPCTRGSVAGRVVLERKPVHVADLQAEAENFPEGSALARRFGHRTIASVPLLREGVAVGTLQIRRTEVKPFTDKQVALLGTFADQAVIAIENARLLNELRESLEQQTATSEVLGVISSSPGDLAPVFETLLANAKRLCGAKFGNIWLCEGAAFRTVAMHGATPEYTEARRRAALIEPAADTGLGRVLKTKRVVQIADIQEVAGYVANPDQAPIVQLAGARSMLTVPMLQEEELIGAIEIYRQVVRPFTEKQIELLQNFAAQAVIAIENARLLNELRQRTADLTESLQQQTATSEILDVISNSPTDSQPAFNAIVRSGLRLFPDAAIMIGLLDGDVVRAAAIADADPAGAEALRARTPIPLSREFITSTAILDRREIDLPDFREAPEELAAGARNFLASGYRAQTVVPMMRGEAAIGTVNVVRRRPGPLSDK